MPAVEAAAEPVRGFHGEFGYAGDSIERQFSGADQCADAAAEGVQPSGPVRRASHHLVVRHAWDGGASELCGVLGDVEEPAGGSGHGDAEPAVRGAGRGDEQVGGGGGGEDKDPGSADRGTGDHGRGHVEGAWVEAEGEQGGPERAGGDPVGGAGEEGEAEEGEGGGTVDGERAAVRAAARVRSGLSEEGGGAASRVRRAQGEGRSWAVPGVFEHRVGHGAAASDAVRARDGCGDGVHVRDSGGPGAGPRGLVQPCGGQRGGAEAGDLGGRGAGSEQDAGAAAARGGEAAAVLPGPKAAAVRLWKAAGASGATAEAEVGRAQGADLHADDEDAGRAGVVHQPIRVHVHAAGWVDSARAAADPDAAVQHEPEDISVHPVDAERGRGDQPGGRGHGDLLRQRLESSDGPAGAGPVPPDRADPGGAHLPAGEREHDRGEHFEEGEPEADPGRSGDPERRLQHGVLQEAGPDGAVLGIEGGGGGQIRGEEFGSEGFGRRKPGRGVSEGVRAEGAVECGSGSSAEECGGRGGLHGDETGGAGRSRGAPGVYGGGVRWKSRRRRSGGRLGGGRAKRKGCERRCGGGGWCSGGERRGGWRGGGGDRGGSIRGVIDPGDRCRRGDGYVGRRAADGSCGSSVGTRERVVRGPAASSGAVCDAIPGAVGSTSGQLGGGGAGTVWAVGRRDERALRW